MDLALSSVEVAGIFAVVVFGAFVHGALGFGFPLIATPTIAVLTDVKTSVVLTLLPNFVINLVNVLKEGNWAGLTRHRLVALWVVVGTIAGTQILLHADTDWLRLFLAAAIFFFLAQDTFSNAGWRWIAQAPRSSAAIFGLSAGVLSGATNVTAPPLLVYFLSLGIAPAAMTQALNLCFISGKVVQTAQLGILGQFGGHISYAILPITAAAFLALLPGIWLQNRIDGKTYRRLLRPVLGTMGVTLVLQVVLNRVIVPHLG